MAKFKTGDKVLVLPGNYRSGKVGEVVGFQDGDPAVQLEGLPEPEMFAEYELRLEKSLPTTDTKSLTWIKSGNEYHTLDGRWIIWGDDRRGFSLDDSERVYRSAPGAFNSVEEAKKQAERASQKSLPATDTKALLRAKYSKSFSGPLKAVLTTLLVKYGIAASSQVEYFPGDSGGYKITVQKRSDVDKAERLREEVEREFGIPVYVAF